MKRLLIFGIVAFALLLTGMHLAHGRDDAGFHISSAAGMPVPVHAAPAIESPGRPDQPAASTPLPRHVTVDVEGAVLQPGLHEVARGSRVAAAILTAGGPTRDADIAGVNRAEIAEDGTEIIVPRRGEPAAAAPESSHRTAHGRRHRRKRHSPEASQPSADVSLPALQTLARRSRRYARRKAISIAGSFAPGSVDLEHATAEQLAHLPGSNLYLAERIVSLRELDGGFDSLDDLLDVEGMNESRLARMEPALRL